MQKSPVTSRSFAFALWRTENRIKEVLSIPKVISTEYLYIGGVTGLVVLQDLGTFLGMPPVVTAIPIAALLNFSGVTKSVLKTVFMFGLAVFLLESRINALQFLSKRLKD